MKHRESFGLLLNRDYIYKLSRCAKHGLPAKQIAKYLSEQGCMGFVPVVWA